MSMVIAHNIPALQTYNIVNSTSNALQKSIAKLSSGLRINSAADDAAGLAISEKMRSQIKGLDRAVSNTQDGISMIQTAEGALSETHSILQRMRELSVQAANDTLTQQDRSYIQEEVDQLKEEITRIGNTTQFNKKKLLNGDSSALWSSDSLDTKAIINGGLREVDQFGQKKSIEGNYKIKIKADPGQGEVKKSDIMTIKHENVLTNKSINTSDGVKDVQVDSMTPGTYSLSVDSTVESDADTKAPTVAAGTTAITGSYGVEGTQYSTTSTASFTANGTNVVRAVKIFIEDENGDAQELYSASDSTAIWASDAGTVAAQQTYLSSHVNDMNGSNIAQELGISISVAANADDATKSDITVTKLGEAYTGAISIKYYSDASAATEITAITPSVSQATPKESAVTINDVFQVASGDDLELNGSVLFEVLSKDEDNKTVTLKATSLTLSQSGVNNTATMDNILISDGGTADLSELFGGNDGDGLATLTLGSGYISTIGDGAKFVAHFGASKWDSSQTTVRGTTAVTAGSTTTTTENDYYSSSAVNIKLTGDIDEKWDDKWDNGVFGGKTPTYLMNADKLTNTEVDFKNFILNEKTGTVSQGTVKLITDDNFTGDNLVDLTAVEETTTTTTTGDTVVTTYKAGDNSAVANGDTLAAFTTAYIGKTAQGDVKLRDLDKFWNSEGTFMLDDAKKITLSQGNGKTASVMLYANDTLDEVAKKLNDAIAVDLGQSKYVNDATKFATFVSNDDTGVNSMAVEGTFIIRSVVPGADGEITFSGDENILNAFSLNTIQDSKETTFSVDVEDAHTGKIIAQNVKTTGNVLHGVIHENVDVEFSSLSGVSATWNSNLNKFTYTSKSTDTTLHLADNTTVLQIGANEGEDLGMNIGDMRSHALGIDGVNVMSHDRAARSITLIDNAIDKVSTQRANLGAYQNRLEHTASNLTTASENLTSAESRIRDADMAKEMMEFTKLNIMLQAGNSMLAQANQQPQNVLSLIR